MTGIPARAESAGTHGGAVIYAPLWVDIQPKNFYTRVGCQPKTKLAVT